MGTLIFCIAGLFAGASDAQIIKALGGPLFDGLVLAIVAILVGRWLWSFARSLRGGWPEGY